MSNEFVEYRVIEPSFGSSTSLAVKFSDGIVAESINTSTGETNYIWDGGFKDGMLEGKTQEEADEFMEHWFDDFEDEYRQPYIAQLSLSEKEWKKIKAQRIKREAIWKKREDRFQLRQKNKDVLKAHVNENANICDRFDSYPQELDNLKSSIDNLIAEYDKRISEIIKSRDSLSVFQAKKNNNGIH